MPCASAIAELCRYNAPLTGMKLHVVHPLGDKFRESLRDFADICEDHYINILKEAFTTCSDYDWVEID